MTIQQEKYKEYENNNLFDDFYSEIYDQLVFVPSKNLFELSKIQSNINQKENKRKIKQPSLRYMIPMDQL